MLALVVVDVRFLKRLQRPISAIESTYVFHAGSVGGGTADAHSNVRQVFHTRLLRWRLFKFSCEQATKPQTSPSLEVNLLLFGNLFDLKAV